ncbi:LysR family transcriptional regulator [Fictibacillus aquaticus]|uniref:LysR family transcriptional regulator n=1 Tax=Fictibacillus aquaticus TaxID=2021314 RepID=A0A235FBH4_9BACL|nr:LysR family transcriptional regulator [Fictibacillus aquaticus]OYD58582.1 LysR family transcriptional regulator [Fictibacillus aquaticus]
MIDFEWYRSFISIYKYRSVSAAAKARIMTQPAMSQHLAALEGEVGEQLFLRAPRKMIPTERGKELYTKIVPLIESLESMTQEIRHDSLPSAMPAMLRVGSPLEFFTKAAIKKLKGIELRFSANFGVAENLLASLEKDELDLIITTQKVHVPGIEYTKLEDEEFVVVAPIDYPNIEEVDVEEWLLNQKWLTYGLELPIIRRYWREHFNQRPSMEPYFIIPNLQAILEAVEQGLGISILPAYLFHESIKENKVKILFPEYVTKNTIYAAYKMENKDHPLFKLLIDELKK